MPQSPLRLSLTRRELIQRSALAGGGAAAALSLAATLSTPRVDAQTAGEITIAVPSYWGTLDYRKLADFYEWSVATLTYSALVRNDDSFQPIPDLAESWENTDPTTLVFHLRAAKFHDGTDVTSADVKATFDSLINPDFGAPNRPLFAAIASVDATDPQTVTMHLSAPSPALLAFLPWVGIVPKAYAEQHPDDVATKPIGCGPYKFVSTVQQAETVLEAFDGYWGGAPAFSKLTYRVIPESTTRTIEVQSGNVDMVTAVAFSDVNPLKDDTSLYVVEVPPNSFSYIGLNLQNPILADVNVRQAIAYAIDRDSINLGVYEGLAQKAIGPVLPSSWGFEPGVTVYEYDQAKSKELLTTSGHADGLEFALTALNSPEFTQIATILTQQLDEVGIKITVTPVEQTVLTQQVIQGEYGDMLLGFGWGQQMDPLQHMYRQFLSANQPPNGYNFVHFENADLDAVLTTANTSLDIEERKAAISEAQKIITAAAPYVFLFHVPEFWAVSQDTTGVTAPAPMDRRFFSLAMEAKKA